MPNLTPTAQEIAEKLNLKPLPKEGGLFGLTYMAGETISPNALPARYVDRVKPYSTAIFYLLTDDADSFSALHRLPTDEVYHFYLGNPVQMCLLYPDGTARTVILGQDIFNGQHVQFVVPAGVWQGSHVVEGGSYALLGTTMAPGYSHGDYEPGSRRELISSYPQAAKLINRLTRE
jgi:uncharacterized protein